MPDQSDQRLVEELRREFVRLGLTADQIAGIDAFTAKYTQPGRATDEQWARMTARERLDYTRQFDQRQFENNR
jgi:hypothetical protein